VNGQPEPSQEEREEAAKLLNRDDMPPPTADEVDSLVEALKRMRRNR
jgi:HAMP domain-containing protein